MKVIGLSGYARSGKDTFADVLVERHGYTKIAFADKMRDFLYAQNPIVGVRVVVHPFDDPEGKLQLGYEPQNIRLQEVIDEFGWDGYKKSPYVAEMRPLVQRTGTEAGRQTLWDNIWVDAAFKGLDPDGKYVFSDVRFLNEAEAVKDHGGLLLRIHRSGVGPAVDDAGNAHISETALDDYLGFDYLVKNNDDLELFKQKVDWILFKASADGRLAYA